MPTIRVDDIDISYALYGEGHPVVMIMGYSGNLDWWPPELVNIFARHYKLLMFDNRGTGNTSVNGWSYSIPLLAKDTVGLMDALGIQRAHIFGISMGGLVAQEIALGYPNRVHQLVLGCTGCGHLWGAKFSLNSIILWIEYLTRADVHSRKLLTNLFFSQTFLTRHPNQYKLFRNRVRKNPTSTETLLKQIVAMLCFDSYSRLRHIQAHSLILTGTDDIMVPPQNSDILAAHIPHAHLATFKGCGHGFVIEAADAVAEKLIGFLEP